MKITICGVAELGEHFDRPDEPGRHSKKDKTDNLAAVPIKHYCVSGITSSVQHRHVGYEFAISC